MTENMKAALEYAVALAEGKEVVHEVNAKHYFDSSRASLKELEPIRYAETLKVNTLTGLVQFLKAKFDNPQPGMTTEYDNEKLMIQVVSPVCVRVLSRLDPDRRRECLVQANATLDKFDYGQFMDSERFNINILSLFMREKDAEAVLKCASSIRIEDSADLSDNGVTQNVTVKQGARVDKAEVPSPAILKPYRTFLEVDQPESQFIFRLNEKGNCALFEADGGLWKYEAMENVYNYLKEQLGDEIEQELIEIIS